MRECRDEVRLGTMRWSSLRVAGRSRFVCDPLRDGIVVVAGLALKRGQVEVVLLQLWIDSDAFVSEV